MTFGEKLAKARKEKNITQDQLADLLNVTRQSISRWESDIAYPEVDKIIRLAEILDLDCNYLLKDSWEENIGNIENHKESNSLLKIFGGSHYEYKSKKMVHGVPLVHVNIGIGFYKAKGIIAIGNNATGVIAIGMAAVGILSCGLFSLGILSIGLFALGLLVAIGCISLGCISIGCIAIGLFTIGAISVGLFSYGALSIGKFVAIGDIAKSDLIGVGCKEATGSIYKSFSGQENVFNYTKLEVVEYINNSISSFWTIFKEWIKAFL